MAPNSTSSNPTGPCEKFFGAVIGTTALRARRRASLMAQHPKPYIASASCLPISKVGPTNGEADGVVPVMFVLADEEKKSKVEMSHEPRVSSAEEDTAKHKANTEPAVIINYKKDMAQPERQMPKAEAPALQLSLQGNPESRVEPRAKPVAEQRQKKEGNADLYHKINHRSAAYISEVHQMFKSNLRADDSIAKMKEKSSG